MAADTADAQISIGWVNLQWPLTYSGTSCSGEGIYGQVWIDGVTGISGPTPGLLAQLGFGPVGSTADNSWAWIDAEFNTDAGNNDEFVVNLNHVLPPGDHNYAYRYRLDGNPDWLYADIGGPVTGGVLTNPGLATITEACGALTSETLTWGGLKAQHKDSVRPVRRLIICEATGFGQGFSGLHPSALRPVQVTCMLDFIGSGGTILTGHC